MEDIKNYLHLYYGQPIYWRIIGKGEFCRGIIDDYIIKNISELEIKWPLRTLPDMTDEEVLELCKVASPKVFGDYRFRKWVVERSHHDICHWTVSNKNSLDYFNVSSADGDVDIYGEDRIFDPTNIDSNYRFWYLKKGFDLFGLIESGLAIDKTKLPQTNK